MSDELIATRYFRFPSNKTLFGIWLSNIYFGSLLTDYILDQIDTIRVHDAEIRYIAVFV